MTYFTCVVKIPNFRLEDVVFLREVCGHLKTKGGIVGPCKNLRGVGGGGAKLASTKTDPIQRKSRFFLAV